MKAQIIKKSAIAASAFFLACCSVDWSMQQGFNIDFSTAEARIGRPATPVSGAGVARRHGAGVYYRAPVARAVAIGAIVSTLPRNCSSVIYNNMTYYRCGSVYYQSSGNGYIIVGAPR